MLSLLFLAPWSGALALTSAVAAQLGLAEYASAERVRQVVGWLMVGVAAVLVEIGLIWLLYKQLGVPMTVASAVAAELLILGRFLVQDHWVFGYARPAWGRLARWHGAAAGSFVVSWVVLNGAFSVLGVDYRVAWLLGTAASVGWSFLTSFFWVWRPGQAETASPDAAAAISALDPV